MIRFIKLTQNNPHSGETWVNPRKIAFMQRTPTATYTEIFFSHRVDYDPSDNTHTFDMIKVKETPSEINKQIGD